jgi:hypothetical protein
MLFIAVCGVLLELISFSLCKLLFFKSGVFWGKMFWEFWKTPKIQLWVSSISPVAFRNFDGIAKATV